MKKELKAKEDALELQAGDKMRLKELSEGYMKEIAALEAQLEDADIKPKQKITLRPKDTIRPISSHPTSHQTLKVRLVEPKQLEDVSQHIRLVLLKE